jgi:zinc protease
VPSRGTGDTQDAAALEVLAQILGSGITSRFAERLQLADKTAIDSGAWYSAESRDASTFSIYAVPTAGTDLAIVEAGLDAALAEMIASGPTEEELNRVKRRIRANEIYAQDSQSTQARRYGSALAIGLDLDAIAAWPAQIEAVTAEDVQRAAATLLKLDNSITGWLVRKEEEQG